MHEVDELGEFRFIRRAFLTAPLDIHPAIPLVVYLRLGLVFGVGTDPACTPPLYFNYLGDSPHRIGAYERN